MWDIGIVNSQTLYFTKALQLKQRIVIAYELKPPDHRGQTKESSLLP